MKLRISTLLEPFQALHNRTFARLYATQTVSLLGDAFTWVGLALPAYATDPDRSPVTLAMALTLRVLACIIFTSFTGVLANRVPCKRILYLTHLTRTGIVACLPLVTAEWQIYLRVLLLNAFFTPTYRAIIPQGGLPLAQSMTPTNE
ncbi:hypothetical protein [Lewinella sp. JB7]|uniref:hypothetical protein n=1 Tax=Lewinella sp. JB7 TaxID=2962887 RepID=UPI0020C969E0|nr:hypothetical protein [Lewinella sp. JB7]MCP9234723.1 hypothetical protein [Lewinella sp. JB7]